MSDWQLSSSVKKKGVSPPSAPSDWALASQEPPESLGTSAALAIPRVAEDIYKKGYETIQKVPEYWDKYKKELPGFWKNAFSHPGSMAMQGLAGANELVNSFNQLPVQAAQYGNERLHLLPKGAENTLRKVVPEDTTEAINQLFGQPKYSGEGLFRGTIRNAPGIASAAGAAKALNPLNLLSTKNGIKNSLLDSHDLLEGRASDAFKHVSDEVNNRGINKLPVSPKFFNSIKHYFPNTRASADLLEKAKTGDYNSIRKIQSDIYARAKKNLSSDLEADRLKGAEMLEKREDINQAISNHLKNTGNHDLDEILNGARNDWKTLQKTYYNDNINNSLVKMFDKNIRKVPNNLVNLLSEESIPMQNLLDFHPGLEKQVAGYRRGRGALKKYGKYALPAVTALGGYEYGKKK